MARIRLIVLAVLAVVCVRAEASSSALARSAKGEFVNKKSEAFVKQAFTATSGETKLETTGGTKITCTSDLALGVNTSTTGGEQTVHFKGCTSSTLPCSTTGAATGEIVVLTGLLVTILAAEEDGVVNTVFESGTKKAGTLNFTCSGIKIAVKGSFYSNGIKTESALLTLIPISATQTKGIQAILTNKAGVERTLETSIEGKGFEKSGQAGTETVHLLEEGKFI